ncbi:putative lipid carrier protein YhbT [Acidovorax sp. 62]|uniref:ubiquinone anaerobic biosynthesis accessory factor UbiT n=1 Tax=Acidovorax sp. 62 TaxID=2035203 RepID=UPI000C18B521|nr:SCP2 sterol-binding domain-containing protein [Acidovorax sp. 62]PIF92457.1 putative lipid carrier protein YhbT [Acidovorax sp. 62]
MYPPAHPTAHPSSAKHHTARPRQLPAPVGAVLSRLPAYPGSVLLVTALNLALARHLPADVLALLLHRKLRIEVRDARVAFDFAWNGQRFAPCSPARPGGAAKAAGAPSASQATNAPNTHNAPDLTISASAHDFVLLAQRQQDPDTLFFSRRLSMQGDTELGLVVKNALDALELPVLDPAQWAPRAVLARLFPKP